MNEEKTAETKRPSDIVDTVVGTVKTALDPEYKGSLADLLMEVEKIDVYEFGVKHHEDITIDIPFVFFARSGEDGKLKLVSVGGEMSVMSEEERALFTQNRMYMKLKKLEGETAYLKNYVEELEKGIEEKES